MEQPEKKNETPKIIGLVVLIIFALVFVAFRVMSTTKPAPPPAPAVTPTPIAIGPAGNPGAMMVASIKSPGVLRDPNTPLDDGDAPLINGQGSEMHQVFNVPLDPNQRKAIDAYHNLSSGKQRPGNPVVSTITNSRGQQIVTGQTETLVQPPLTHPEAIKVEGVVTGRDGFAMISMDGNTMFKRVGDFISDGYRISRLSENGLVVRYNHEIVRNNRLVNVSEPKIWPIGEPTMIAVPGPPVGPASVMAPIGHASLAPIPAPDGMTLPRMVSERKPPAAVTNLLRKDHHYLGANPNETDH